jgi:hypothetical protein
MQTVKYGEGVPLGFSELTGGEPDVVEVCYLHPNGLLLIFEVPKATAMDVKTWICHVSEK